MAKPGITGGMPRVGPGRRKERAPPPGDSDDGPPPKPARRTASAAARAGTKAAATGPEEVPRRCHPLGIGELLPEVGGVAFRRFGFARGALLLRWREVVGPVYARWSVPEALKPGRGGRGATLVIRVEGAFATQMHHVLPQIRARANTVLGHDAIGAIRLVQGSIPRRRALPPPPEGAAAAPSAPNLQGIADPELRAALRSLAEAIARG